MKIFSVQYDEPGIVPASPPKLVVIGRTDTLAEAITMNDKDSHSSYILHVPSDLRRSIKGGRVVWLDAQGRESPQPS